MNARGKRFIPEQAMLWVAIDYTCSVCWPVTKTVLLRHKITTSAGQFEDEHETFAGDDAAEEQFVREPDGNRFRYKLTCPRCGHNREIRGEKLILALRAVYQSGVSAKLVRHLI